MYFWECERRPIYKSMDNCFLLSIFIGSNILQGLQVIHVQSNRDEHTPFNKIFIKS